MIRKTVSATILTHCRFFAQRVVNNEYLSTNPTTTSTYRVVRADAPRETACIERIAQRIKDRYGYTVSTDEKLYIMIHLIRLTE